MKILVTGSSGFIGYHLTKKLISLGYQVIGIDNHNDYYEKELKELRRDDLEKIGLKFYQTDINNLESLNESFDLIIHLAAQAGVRVLDKKVYQISNVNGFKAICDFAKKNQVSKIIYASSSSVYSDNLKTSFIEDNTKLSPKSFYGKTKLFNENYAKKISKENDFSMIGLRFFSVYGPFGRPDMAYYLFSKNLLENKKITVFNEGVSQRDMTYIDDVVEGIIQAKLYLMKNCDNIEHEVFNLGNETPIKTIDMLQTLQKKLKKSANIVYQTSDNESKFTKANISKARRILGYNPQINFNDGIDLFIRWLINYEKRKK